MPRPRKSASQASTDAAVVATPSPHFAHDADHIAAANAAASPSAPPATSATNLPAPASAVITAPVTKTDMVLALLRREQGATVAEMMDATGWLAHTTRAALTGLRKKGHALVKTKRDEVTCYRLAVAD